MLAFVSLVLLVLVTFSRAVEYPVLLSLHLATVSFGFAMIGIPFGGGLGRMLRDRISHGLLLLTMMMIVATVFGIWRSGGLEILQVYWSRSCIVFLALSAGILTFSQFRKIIVAFILAFIAISIYSLMFGGAQQGRLTMDSGFFSNPNDLATIIVMALPICWVGSRIMGNPILKVGLLLSTSLLWMTFLRTGSRGGFIAMTVTILVLFFHVPFRRKLQLMIAGAALLIGAVAFLPSATLKRFVIFSDSVRFADFEEGEVDAYTSASSEGRMEMAQQGVLFTIQHPIFGVGPGNFRVASTGLFKGSGMNAPWTDVHNTYLQISSENGIPALIIYVYLLLHAARRLTTIYRTYRDSPYEENRWISDSAWYLRLSLISYMVSAFFGNYSYQYHIHILLGLTIALTSAEANRPETVRIRHLPGYGGAISGGNSRPWARQIGAKRVVSQPVR